MALPVKREYVVLFQELVGKSYRWPRAIRDMVFAQHHLNNKERFYCVLMQKWCQSFSCDGVLLTVLRLRRLRVETDRLRPSPTG